MKGVSRPRRKVHRPVPRPVLMPTVSDWYANERVKEFMSKGGDKDGPTADAIGFIDYPETNDDLYHHTDATPAGFTWATLKP